MHDIATEIVSIADACLGGLRDRTALLIGPEELRAPYAQLLRQAYMHYIYQEATLEKLSILLPKTQLLISVPAPDITCIDRPAISAARIAHASSGRRTPLLIFDLAETPSVEELAGLLPAVCLYTPSDLQHILARKEEAKAS